MFGLDQIILDKNIDGLLGHVKTLYHVPKFLLSSIISTKYFKSKLFQENLQTTQNHCSNSFNKKYGESRRVNAIVIADPHIIPRAGSTLENGRIIRSDIDLIRSVLYAETRIDLVYFVNPLCSVRNI